MLKLNSDPYIITHLQLRGHLLALVDPCYGITNQLVNNGLCALLLIYNSGGLAHKEGAGVVHGL